MSSTTAVSLFSGLGGMDLGARIAGVDVSVATDHDEAALGDLAATQGTRTLVGDIRELLASGAFEAAVDTRPTMLFGGPPCTGFSHAGFWIESKRNGLDPATALLWTYIDVVRLLEPRLFVLENVPGLQFKNFRASYDALLNRARRGGYSITAQILDASRHGVPQARRRLFVIGVRGGPRIDLSDLPRMPQRSSSWAIGDLQFQGPPEFDERPTGKHRRWLDQVPPGENYLCLTTERGHPEGAFKYRGRYWSFLLKLHPDRPSPTIPAQRVTYNGPFHWSGRHLRVRELARLQMFPDWQRLSADLPGVRRHIGNAVPPLLAAAVVRHVLERLDLAASDRPLALEVSADASATFGDVTAAYPRHVPSPKHECQLIGGPSLRGSDGAVPGQWVER